MRGPLSLLITLIVFVAAFTPSHQGTQFKTIVEYALSQRVPKKWSKKDGREGTIGKDPEYLEFLEFISKPVENLPSAEIQLEKKEAERAGQPMFF
ncbi:putative nonsense-mediated mRNA decay protein [Helianthus annuus]|nr:putative nonsense-mediated mRNA decay protein [Helianthus annuus]